MWAPRPAAWSNATGVEQFERLWWQDLKAKRFDEIERHMASAYTASGARGTITDRQAVLDHLKQIDLQDYTIGTPSIQPNGGTVVISYSMDMRGAFAGQSFDFHNVQMMSIWQQQKRGWVQIAHSESAAP